jgi:hypothetical protein
MHNKNFLKIIIYIKSQKKQYEKSQQYNFSEF